MLKLSLFYLLCGINVCLWIENGSSEFLSCPTGFILDLTSKKCASEQRNPAFLYSANCHSDGGISFVGEFLTTFIVDEQDISGEQLRELANQICLDGYDDHSRAFEPSPGVYAHASKNDLDSVESISFYFCRGSSSYDFITRTSVIEDSFPCGDRGLIVDSIHTITLPFYEQKTIYVTVCEFSEQDFRVYVRQDVPWTCGAGSSPFGDQLTFIYGPSVIIDPCDCVRGECILNEDGSEAVCECPDEWNGSQCDECEEEEEECPDNYFVVDDPSVKIGVSFNGKSPSHKIYPRDKCGNTIKEDIFVLVEFQKIREQTPNGNLVHEIDFPSEGYYISESALGRGFNGIFPGNFDSSDIQISVDIDVIAESQTIIFANSSFDLNPSSSKWNGAIKNWKFESMDNVLMFEVKLFFGTKDIQSGTSLDIIETIQEDNAMRVRMRTNNLRVDMTLPNLVEIDEGNEIKHFNPSFDPETRTILLPFPSFSSSLFYDPNFGVFFGSNDNSDSCEDTFPIWAIIFTSIVGAFILFMIVGIIIGVSVFLIIKFVRHHQKSNLEAAVDIDNHSSPHRGL